MSKNLKTLRKFVLVEIKNKSLQNKELIFQANLRSKVFKNTGNCWSSQNLFLEVNLNMEVEKESLKRKCLWVNEKR